MQSVAQVTKSEFNGCMNTDWHSEHELGSHAPMAERVKWHIQHAEKCACRPIPKDVQDAIAERSKETAST